MSHGPDTLDNAAELTQQLNDAYVASARRKAGPEQVQGPDGVWPHTECECGEEIPAGRLALGKIRCIDCQIDLERGRARR